MFKPVSKPVQKHAKILFGMVWCFAYQNLWAAGVLGDTGSVESVVVKDERGYIWNSGLIQILEEAGVAVASPRSVDPKLRLHYYLAQCDQLIAEGDLEATDAKIQEALLDLSGMKGLLERQARVAGMVLNLDRANSYWASVISHPGATVNNLADAAWSYLLAGQRDFGEFILEMGEKRDATHPRLLLLRKLYQFKNGETGRAVVLNAQDIPSLFYRIRCRKKEIEVLGGAWLFDDVCGWLLRGGALGSNISSDASPVLMEDGTVLFFSDVRARPTIQPEKPIFARLTQAVEHLSHIQTYELLGAWDEVLAELDGLRKLGAMGLYLDLLEVNALGRSGWPMQSRALVERLLEEHPKHGPLYFVWGRLLMDWGAYQEALGAFEKCQNLGYNTGVLDAWLAACYTQLFNDPKAKQYIAAGLQQNKAIHFKKQISHEEKYWSELRHLVALQRKTKDL